MSYYSNDDNDPWGSHAAKRPARNPAAAYAASGVMTGLASTPETYKSMVSSHLLAARSSSADSSMRTAVDMVRRTTFAEYDICDMPSHENKIIRKDAIELCGSACGCTDQTVFPQTLPKVQTPENVVHIRNEWFAASQKASSMAKAEVRIKERDTWLVYVCVMINVVRPHVINSYRQMLSASLEAFSDAREEAIYDEEAEEEERKTGEASMALAASASASASAAAAAAAPTADPSNIDVQNARQLANRIGKPTLYKFESLLRAFDDDLQLRATLDIDMKDQATPLVCFKHSRVGHLVPMHGYRGYDPSCFICPTLSHLEIVRHEPVSLIPPEADPANRRAKEEAEYGFGLRSMFD